MSELPRFNLAEAGEALRRDGVARIAGALDPREMQIIEAAFDWKRQNPGPLLQHLYPEGGLPFLNARGQSFEIPQMGQAMTQTRVPEIVAHLFGSGPVWFHGEQIWMKDSRGKATGARRTPWHQDASYDPFLGAKTAVVWITLDPVPQDCALEVVRGSHKGPLFNAPRIGDQDDTAEFFPGADRPRMPDIQANRDSWDIVSWPAERGDLLIFHSKTLHGGGGTRPDMRRRSLTLRFVGDDVVRIEMPEQRSDGSVRAKSAVDMIPVGDFYHKAGLPKVHPGVRVAASASLPG